MPLGRKDKAGGVAAGLTIGIVFGVIAALALVWLLFGHGIGGGSSQDTKVGEAPVAGRALLV